MRNASITGWGKCLPPTLLTNHDLESIVDTNDEWITTRTGIKERRISHVPLSDLAALAGKRALAAAGLDAADVDVVMVATCTPDTLLPSTAGVVQHKIGATSAGAFDQNAACSGFLYSLISASGMIAGGVMDTALVIGADMLTHLLDFTDRSTAVLFGDGAGAVVLQATEEEAGILASRMGSDGSVAEILWVEGSGSATGHTEVEKNHKLAAISMDGPEVFKRAVKAMGDASSEVIEEAGWTLDDVDLFIPHQANARIIDSTARRLKLDSAKVFVNIESYGNTSAATIPIALTEALEAGRVRPGSNLVFAAFGAGLSWAAAALKFGDRVTPVGTSHEELPHTDATVFELLADNFAYFGGGQ